MNAQQNKVFLNRVYHAETVLRHCIMLNSVYHAETVLRHYIMLYFTSELYWLDDSSLILNRDSDY
jgi:hypothetical protein